MMKAVRNILIVLVAGCFLVGAYALGGGHWRVLLGALGADCFFSIILLIVQKYVARREELEEELEEDPDLDLDLDLGLETKKTAITKKQAKKICKGMF